MTTASIDATPPSAPAFAVLTWAKDLRPISELVIWMALGALLASLILGITAMSMLSERFDASNGEQAVACVAAAAPITGEKKIELSTSTMATVAVQTFKGERETTGRIAFNADKVTPVFSPYTGRITRLMAVPGQKIKKGDPLFEIDTPDIVQVESDLIGAVSGLKNSETALVLAKQNLGIAEREISSGQRKVELTKINEERQKKLYAEQSVAQRDYENAQHDHTQAQQDLEQANKDVEQAHSDIKTAEASIAAADAVVNASRDRLLRFFYKTPEEVAEIEKSHHIDSIVNVFSPIEGTVTQRQCGAGEFISQNITSPLFMVTDLSTVWMLADVYETDVAWVKVGEPIEISVMAYPEHKFKAEISYISPSSDPNTHRVAVRCVVNNPGEILKSDMFASFRFFTPQVLQAAAVPEKAISRESYRLKSVWVVQQDSGTVFKRKVDTGFEQNGFVQILSGLQPGETILCEPNATADVSRKTQNLD